MNTFSKKVNFCYVSEIEFLTHLTELGTILIQIYLPLPEEVVLRKHNRKDF